MKWLSYNHYGLGRPAGIHYLAVSLTDRLNRCPYKVMRFVARTLIRTLMCAAQGMADPQALMRFIHAQQAQQAQREAMFRVQQQQAQAQAQQHAPNHAPPGQPSLLGHFAGAQGFGGGQPGGHMAPNLAHAQAQHQATLRAQQQQARMRPPAPSKV